MDQVLFSSKSDDWKTPSIIYNEFMNNDFIDCFQFQSKENEFLNNYYHKKLYINPPFSKLKYVADWVIKQIPYNKVIVLLIPSRTDTRYFHKLLRYNPDIIFIFGRLHFNDLNCAPFPSLFMVFYPGKSTRFYDNATIDEFLSYIKQF